MYGSHAGSILLVKISYGRIDREYTQQKGGASRVHCAPYYAVYPPPFRLYTTHVRSVTQRKHGKRKAKSNKKDPNYFFRIDKIKIRESLEIVVCTIHLNHANERKRIPQFYTILKGTISSPP